VNELVASVFPGSRNLKFVSKFGSFASIVVSLMRVPHSNSIITATKDGSVKMWSLDTLQPQLAMKSAAGVSSFSFIDTSRCLLSHGRTVRLLSLRHCFPVLLMCDSDVVSMQRNSKKSVLLWCEVQSPNTPVALPIMQPVQRCRKFCKRFGYYMCDICLAGRFSQNF
jgi:WD40 repeat protein